jgi:hypothetical protein
VGEEKLELVGGMAVSGRLFFFVFWSIQMIRPFF